MKRLISVAVAMVMYVAVFAAAGFGQGTEITEEAYNELMNNARRFLATEIHRSNTVTERCGPDKCDWTPIGETHNEFVPPNRRRSLTYSNRGEPEPNIETISIDGKLYTRTSRQGWTLQSMNLATSSNSDLREIAVCYYDLGEDKTGRKPARYLMKTVAYSSFTGEGKTELSHIYISWINEAGNLMGTETIVSGSGTTMTRMVTTYEIDPNIKIEGPIP